MALQLQLVSLKSVIYSHPVIYLYFGLMRAGRGASGGRPLGGREMAQGA